MTHAIRPPTPADGDALADLFDACPLEGAVALAPDRRPDVFALSRLKGERGWMGVVDGPDGRPVGCVAVDERAAFVAGRAVRTMVVSDLRVHPAHRRRGVGGALMRWARDRCVDAGGERVPTFVAVLAGSDDLGARLARHRDLPSLHRFATVRCWSIPLLWARPGAAPAALRVTPATTDDLEEMAALWATVAPTRQFAPVLDAAALAAWMEAAPGLEPSSYLLARGPGGRVAGFLGVWDQSSFKRLRVTGYSPRMRAARAAVNAVAPVVGGTPLPPVGEPLRHVVVVHPCVPASEPAVLRALLRAAYERHRRRGWSFLTIGLDRADPLTPAVRGLLAQPTDVWACVATLGPRWEGPPLADRPAHHEIALV